MRENKFEPELKGVGAPVSSLARSTFNKSFGSLKCSPADGQGDHEPEVGRALRARRPAGFGILLILFNSVHALDTKTSPKLVRF